MDPVRYFVRGIAVGTVLCKNGTGSKGRSTPFMEYLAAHPSFKIRYSRGMKLVDLLSGYADAGWDNSSSRRSTSGMVMLYNKSPIMWKSKIQKTTALSTARSSTTLHRLRAVRSCTSGHFCADSASGRGSLHRSARTTRRVLCFADSLQAKARARH